MGCTTSSLAAHINLVRDSSVPDKVIRGQLALFNSPMRTWIKRELVSLYIVAMLPCILTCDVYLCDLLYKRLRFGTFDLQQDLGKPSRGKPSQATSMGSSQKHPKPHGWGGCEAVYFGTEASMTHSQQCQWRLSCSSMYESIITDR